MDAFSHLTGLLFQDKDPFVDDINAEFHIGSVKIWLQSTSYMVCLTISISLYNFYFQRKSYWPFEYLIHVSNRYIELNGLMKTFSLCTIIIFAKIAMKEQLDVIDFRGYEVGKVNVSHTSFLIHTPTRVWFQCCYYTLRKQLLLNLSIASFFKENDMKKNYHNIYSSIICKVYHINKVGCIHCVFPYYIKNLNISFPRLNSSPVTSQEKSFLRMKFLWRIHQNLRAKKCTSN